MYRAANRAARSVKASVAVLVIAVLASGCGASGVPGEGGGSVSGGDRGSPSGERISVGGTEGIIWGEGDRGAVLAHGAAYDSASWEPQGRKLGENGVMALAVEDTSAENLGAAIRYLKEQGGAESVALIGASAGASSVLSFVGEEPREASQIILLSGTGDVSDLGELPKLLVASEGEGLAEEVRRMSEDAPGERNEALILPGDAHAQAIFQTEQGERLMRAITERLEEYG